MEYEDFEHLRSDGLAIFEMKKFMDHLNLMFRHFYDKFDELEKRLEECEKDV